MLDKISSLHVPWHPEKGSPSFSDTMVFIGLCWDFIAKTISLPEHKRLKYLNRVHSFLDRFTRCRTQLHEVERIHRTLCYISFIYLNGHSQLPSLSNFVASFKGNEFKGKFSPLLSSPTSSGGCLISRCLAFPSHSLSQLLFLTKRSTQMLASYGALAS
jgi:hypothetical protein